MDGFSVHPILGVMAQNYALFMETQNKDEKKNGHGGRRVGAGRKPKDDAKKNVVGFRVSNLAVQNLKAYAEKVGKTRNDVINELLEGLM